MLKGCVESSRKSCALKNWSEPFSLKRRSQEVRIVHLWDIFDQRDEELDIGAEVEKIEPLQDGADGQNEADQQEDENSGDDQLADPRNRLVASL